MPTLFIDIMRNCQSLIIKEVIPIICTFFGSINLDLFYSKRTTPKTNTQTKIVCRQVFNLNTHWYINFLLFLFTGIKDVIIWGNITGNNYVDLRKAKVCGYESAIWGLPHYSRPVLSLIFDRYSKFFSEVC